MADDEVSVDDEFDSILDDDDEAGGGSGDDSDVLSEPEPEAKKEPEKPKSEELPPPEKVNCRECAHYPFRSQKVTTRISQELRAVTKNFTRSFCGTAPVDGVTCVGKEFTPIE